MLAGSPSFVAHRLSLIVTALIPQMPLHPFAAVARTIVTLGIGLLFGALCHFIGLPAPYLLGSLCGVWAGGALIKPLRDKLAVPRAFIIAILLGLGVVIGGVFTAELFANAAQWSASLLGLIFATALATACGFWHLTVARGYDKKLALLCCLPGGQAEAVAVGGMLGEKDYVVAICHLTRVVLVFFLTPILLSAAFSGDATDASNAALTDLPSVVDVAPLALAQFLGVAVGGYLIALLIRLPMPHLLGPMLLSGALHFFGAVNTPRIAEFMLLAQITVGGFVGAKLARVTPAALTGYLRDSLVNAALIVAIYCLTALALARFVDASPANLLLAFIPGGIYEVTLLTFLFGFDLAFVAFHHVFRVLLIYLALPFITKKFRAPPQ